MIRLIRESLWAKLGVMCAIGTALFCYLAWSAGTPLDNGQMRAETVIFNRIDEVTTTRSFMLPTYAKEYVLYGNTQEGAFAWQISTISQGASRTVTAFPLISIVHKPVLVKSDPRTSEIYELIDSENGHVVVSFENSTKFRAAINQNLREKVVWGMLFTVGCMLMGLFSIRRRGINRSSN